MLKWNTVILIGVILQGSLVIANESESVMGNAGFIIDKKEIPELEQAALNGSGRVALQLSMFYDAIELNRQKALFWARISAENGYSPGQYNYAFMLQQKLYLDDADGLPDANEKRASFWFKRAAASGFKVMGRFNSQLSQ